jgi:hypothetical protein
MNSDFVQVEAEALYKRAAAEPDNRARIRKLYNLAYGRDPKEPEIQAGLEYLKAEPLKEYEESRNKAKEKEAEKEKEKEKEKDKAAETGDAEKKTPEGSVRSASTRKPAVPDTNSAEAEPDTTVETPAEDGAETPANPNAGMGMGMMAGMDGARRSGPPKPVEIKYQPTVWGRYTKLLLSSTEFLFIN